MRPDQVPDFIGLKGDTSDNIPGIPGIGDKTAGQLVAQYGSLESVLEHAGELSAALARDLRERGAGAHVEAPRDDAPRPRARRRPGRPRLPPPDRSQLKEIFRRFEFRGLLSRVDTLDEALPLRSGWSRSRRRWPGARASCPTCAAGRPRGGRRRVAVATGDEVVVAPRPAGDTLSRWGGVDRRARREGAARGGGRRHDDRRVPDRPGQGGVRRPRRPLRGERARARARPAAEEETAALVRHAEAARRLAPVLRERVRERGLERLYDEGRAAAVRRARRDGAIRIDTYRMGEITARLSDRIEELEASAYELAGEEFVLGSPQQLGRILFEKLELTPGGARPGTRPTARCPARDPLRPRDRPGRRGVAGAARSS